MDSQPATPRRSKLRRYLIAIVVSIAVVCLCITIGIFRTGQPATEQANRAGSTSAAAGDTPSPMPAEPTQIGADTPSAIQTRLALADLAQLDCRYKQGKAEMCVVAPDLAANRDALGATLETYCDAHLQPGGFCQIMVWTDEAKVPRSLPMSDAELTSQVAQYNRNLNTGYDCFVTLTNGAVSFQSDGCNP